LLVGAYFAFSGNKGDGAADGTAAAPAAAEGEEGERAAPSVTVMVPGRTTVSHVISSTGTLAARREMPVGVAGEGGQIVRVLVEPGQWVGAGQVLATVDRSVQSQQIEQLTAQIRVSEADARLAQAELNRAQALSGRGFISAADLDRKTATRDSAAARVRVARAQLAEARARTGRLDIRAPAAGLVLTRGVEPGQIVSPGSGVLFRIARGGEMELLANVGEADLAMLSAGARATVTPVGTTTSVNGQIWQLAPVIDPQTRQGVARIALPYSAGIRPGGFAEARIIAGAAQAPLLPESAVQHDETSSYVYIINAGRKASRRNVTTGAVSDSGVPIIAGLTGTEQVVVSAGAFLNDGDAVTPVIQRR
jgi:HlyD family secretion protein